MARSSFHFGLPKSLQKAPPIMYYQLCSVAHMQKASHKRITARPPPGHTLATDISGPLYVIPDGYYFLLLSMNYIP